MSNLTVRQEYAKAAMQAHIGLLANDGWLETIGDVASGGRKTVIDSIVEKSFGVADAMIRHEENEENKRLERREDTKGLVASVQKILNDLGPPEFASDLGLTHVESLCVWDQENDMRDGSHRIFINEYFRHPDIKDCFKGTSNVSVNYLEDYQKQEQLVSSVKCMRDSCCSAAEDFVKEQTA